MALNALRLVCKSLWLMILPQLGCLALGWNTASMILNRKAGSLYSVLDHPSMETIQSCFESNDLLHNHMCFGSLEAWTSS